MLWAEDMWAPRSHLLVRSECWVGTECKLCASLAFLLLPGGREKQRGERKVVSSQHPGKKVCWALGMDAHRAEQCLLRLKKKWAQYALHNESSGQSQAVRVKPRLTSPAAGRTGGWTMGQRDGQWDSRSGKDQEKKWWWEGDFNFCSIQTAHKLTAGHPGRDQGDRLSLSLGLTETGWYWRGRSELSAWKWQLNLCWQQRGGQAPIYAPIYVVLQEREWGINCSGD